MKTRGVVLKNVGEPVSVESLDLTDPRPGEVLVRIGAAGICHSEQNTITGHSPANVPCVLGHEGAGEVVGLGQGVSTVRMGDRVVLNWLPNCGACFYCRSDQHHLCQEVADPLWAETLIEGGTPISLGATPVSRYCGTATWSEHMVVAEQTCVPVSADVPYEVAAVIGCAVATGVGAAVSTGQARSGECVVVVGVGGVGLSAVMGAAASGAGRIIAVDIKPNKRDLAFDLGVTDFLDANDDPVAEVLDMTSGRGADLVIEATGLPHLQQTWISGVRPGGRLVLVGLSGPDGMAAFHGASLTRLGKSVKGSYFAGMDSARAIADLCDRYLKGSFPVDRLITKRVDIDDVQLALDAMLAGTEGRTVISFT